MKPIKNVPGIILSAEKNLPTRHLFDAMELIAGFIKLTNAL
jgi:hypothetical protein